MLNVIRSNEDEIEIHRFDDVGVEVIDVVVDKNSEYIRNHMSVDLLSKYCTLSAIIRNEKIIIPIYTTEIKSGDELLIFCKPEDVKKVESLFQNK